MTLYERADDVRRVCLTEAARLNKRRADGVYTHHPAGPLAAALADELHRAGVTLHFAAAFLLVPPGHVIRPADPERVADAHRHADAAHLPLAPGEAVAAAVARLGASIATPDGDGLKLITDCRGTLTRYVRSLVQEANGLLDAAPAVHPNRT